jgi:hypothetical protein
MRHNMGYPLKAPDGEGPGEHLPWLTPTSFDIKIKSDSYPDQAMIPVTGKTMTLGACHSHCGVKAQGSGSG